jgi:mRNA interferase MazF
MKRFEIWLANLNPSKGTEPGKVRPVVIVQTDLLNQHHPSVIVCPITSRVQPDADILRVHLHKNQLAQASDIMVDQIRAIDKMRLVSKVGKLREAQETQLKKNLAIILDL